MEAAIIAWQFKSNCEATAAATMKARKEDDKKIKDARIAASTKMAEDIFGQNV